MNYNLVYKALPNDLEVYEFHQERERPDFSIFLGATALYREGGKLGQRNIVGRRNGGWNVGRVEYRLEYPL